MHSKPQVLPESDCSAPLDLRNPCVEIRVKGRLDDTWSHWFLGLTVTHAEEDETILSGPIADQAVLYGLLSRLRDLGLSLLSATLVEQETPPSEQGAEDNCTDADPDADSPP